MGTLPICNELWTIQRSVVVKGGSNYFYVQQSHSQLYSNDAKLASLSHGISVIHPVIHYDVVRLNMISTLRTPCFVRKWFSNDIVSTVSGEILGWFSIRCVFAFHLGVRSERTASTPGTNTNHAAVESRDRGCEAGSHEGNMQGNCRPYVLVVRRENFQNDTAH